MVVDRQLDPAFKLFPKAPQQRQIRYVHSHHMLRCKVLLGHAVEEIPILGCNRIRTGKPRPFAQGQQPAYQGTG